MAFLPNECFQTLKKEAEMIIGMRAESGIKRSSEGIEPNPASRPRGPVVCTYIFGGVYFDESIGKTQEFTVHSMYLGILKVQIYITGPSQGQKIRGG